MYVSHAFWCPSRDALMGGFQRAIKEVGSRREGPAVFVIYVVMGG